MINPLVQVRMESLFQVAVVIAINFILLTGAELKGVQPRTTPQLDPTCSLPYPAVFVNPQNGTKNNSCWSEGQDQPCGSLPYAIEGAKKEGIPVVLSPGLYQTNGSCVCDNTESIKENCKAWFYEEDKKCVCGKSLHNAVKCDPKTMSVELLSCYCMTYDNTSKETVVGACLYGCFNITYSSGSSYIPLPQDKLMLNQMMCDDYNRRGQLCGECKEDYYQPAYSYEMACVQCTYHPYNWVLYALAAFGPLTVFYLIILVFRINVASPPLTAFVQLSQLVTLPSMLRSFNLACHNNPNLSDKVLIMNLLTTVYSVWNLDFFRMILPPICLHLKGLQLIAIDYAIACYPMLLVILTYVLIELYDRNVRVVVWFLKPLRACLSFLGLHQRDMKSSVISTFASFILLSYVKFLSVSSDLLLPIPVYNMTGSRHWYLFNFPKIKYFSTTHLPYALVAIAVLLIFIVTPLLLLLLYPFRWFQWLLGYCRLHSHALQTFMDAFQGYLKDGTNGTQDCRQFAAAYLILRIFVFITSGLTISIFFWPLSILFTLTLGLIVVNLKPYKSSVYNTTDAVLVFVLVLWFVSVLTLMTSEILHPKARLFCTALVLLLSVLPLLLAMVAIILWIIKKKFPQRFTEKIRARWRAYREWKSKNGQVLSMSSHSSEQFNGNIGPDCYQLVEVCENTEQT